MNRFLSHITLTMVAVSLLGCPTQANQPNSDPFEQRVNELIAAKKMDEIRQLGVQPLALGWLDHTGRAGDTNWKFHILTTPWSASSETYGVFSCYHSCQSMGDHLHQIIGKGSSTKLGPERKESDEPGFRIRQHRLVVNAHPTTGSADFRDEISVERTGKQAGKTLFMRMSSNIVVKSINSTAGSAIRWKSVPGIMAIQAPDSASFNLTLTYDGPFNLPGMDMFVLPEEMFLNAYWYPHIGRRPAAADVEVTVPSDWTALGQGEFVSAKESGSMKTWKFTNAVPVSYISLVAGKYSLTERKVDGHTLTVYQRRPNPARANAALDTIASAMKYFESEFTKFPYTRYGLVETMGPFDAALEAYSFSIYPRGNFGAAVHELSHTWFGGILSNTYTRSQWNESFAEYATSLYNRRNRPDAPPLSGQHRSPDYGSGLIKAYSVPITQAFDTENNTHSAVGYGKGNQVLLMLEDLLGKEKMRSAVRHFISDHARGEDAEWIDFITAVTKATGEDYKWFFSQWLERAGVPQVRLDKMAVVQTGSKWKVSVTVIQNGTPYRLPITLEVSTAGETSRQSFLLTAATQTFSWECTFKPLDVKLDPMGRLLLAGAPVEGDPFYIGDR